VRAGVDVSYEAHDRARRRAGERFLDEAFSCGPPPGNSSDVPFGEFVDDSIPAHDGKLFTTEQLLAVLHETLHPATGRF
jgi:hypothetical protein